MTKEELLKAIQYSKAADLINRDVNPHLYTGGINLSSDGDGSVYSRSSGAKAMSPIIWKSINQVYDTPGLLKQDMLEGIKREQIRREALKSLMKEGYNPFGGEA